MRIAILLFVLLANVVSVSGQLPHDDWQTLETENFRIHFPSEYRVWSYHAASRLESISEIVGREVGYSPEEKIEVLVMNPMASANGSAWAVLSAPRMILWTTPPDPLSPLGYFPDPVQGLLIHEQVHLAHLLRPSRNPLRSLLESIVPVGPIARDAPRWVSEGYATLLEGELTGAGRPYGEVRAAILRRWAQAGQLPTYGLLDSDSKRWMGMSMAYLVGSAYLEWLRDRTGEDSLRHLWARMSARQRRGFEGAFEGVFGDSPSRLYARFRAELTAEALELEQDIELQEGELWQRLSWTTGAPDVSPDGLAIVAVLRSRENPARMVVWSTGKNEDAEAARQEKIEKMLARDPEDVAPVLSRPLAREPLYQLRARDRSGFYTPRWLQDGESILYTSFEPDARGDLHPDLFVWRPETGERRRVTRSADLRQADPDPSGTWAVAVRHRHGLSELVRVELASGAVEALTEASLDRIYSHPRYRPDGEEIAFVVHEEGRWRLKRLELESGRERDVGLPTDTTLVAYPDWLDEGSMRVLLGRRGNIEIYELELGHSWYARRLTYSRGAALAYASAPDSGELFFLSLEVHGLDLRRLDLSSIEALLDVGDRALGRPESGRLPDPVPEAELPSASPYGIGKQEWMALVGGAFGPSARSLEAGARLGDLVGRLDTLLIGSVGQYGGTEGLALVGRWKGWPIEISAHLFDLEERPSQQSASVPGLGSILDGARRGVEIAASWDRHWRDTRLVLEGRGLSGKFEPDRVFRSLDQSRLYGGAVFRHRRSLSRGHYGFTLGGVLAGGRTGDDSWSSTHYSIQLLGGMKKHRAAVTWKRAGVDGAEYAIDRIVVGGLPSSIRPSSLEINRMSSSALPRGILIGGQYESFRLALETDLLPVDAFYERHRVWDEGTDRSPWLELVGLEITKRSEPIPLLRLPAFELGLGAAVLLETPFPELDDEIEWWLSLTFRP